MSNLRPETPSIIDLCRIHFDSAILARGQKIQRSRTLDHQKTAQGVAKFVAYGSGSKPYEVRVDASDIESGQLALYCSCPHYEDGAFCKHLWASILYLVEHPEAAPLIPPGTQTLGLVHEFRQDPDQTISHFAPKTGPEPAWLRQIHRTRTRTQTDAVAPFSAESTLSVNPRQAWFGIRSPYEAEPQELTVELFYRQHRKNGKLGGFQRSRISLSDIALYPDSLDRELLAMLFVGAQPRYLRHRRPGMDPSLSEAVVHPAILNDFLEKLSRTERGFFLNSNSTKPLPSPLIADPGDPWRFELNLFPEAGGYRLKGFFVRKPANSDSPVERRPLSDAIAPFRSGSVLFHDRIGKLDPSVHLGWLFELRGASAKTLVPFEQGRDFANEILKDPHCPVREWPPELEWKRTIGTPKPLVTLTGAHLGFQGNSWIRAGVYFEYGTLKIQALTPPKLHAERESSVILERDIEQEQMLMEKFGSLGLEFTPLRRADPFPYRFSVSHLKKFVNTLLSWGWRVEAEGRKIRALKEIKITTHSGIDWFELRAHAPHDGGDPVRLSALLAALKTGHGMIELGDGTLGMAPEQWLSKFTAFAHLGTETEEGIRFTKSQGLLISLWLAREEATPDFSGLQELKQTLKTFTHITPLQPLEGFQGSLRPYQSLGLGWLKTLQNAGMGGILADDMGLGKTVQILAHLQHATQGPSLILLPKSLLHNWAAEAARFTPNLRVLIHHGNSRAKSFESFADYDLILMTYATARIDFDRLKDVSFYFVIADEAQAIKNPDSQSARACKLIQARHRLALTGTPIENSIQDLISIMDFTNPGILGSWRRNENPQALQSLAKAISPFILRRTKQQVLRELPPKTELILHCELSPREWKNYTDLRDHYRSTLKRQISSLGLTRSKILVFEALLRLRQAACHPGLIDKKMRTLDSTKLDLLVEQLLLIRAEGHKALVFSQFTSLLDLVRTRLEKEGIKYEHLDGKTRNRAERVKRFQEQDEAGVFLISLKAGGTGLNLTAADYVFLLDPWWNPAVESQAIDRAHRIGQKNKVMAYRLIARDTVEEKIIALQKQKRELADAIVNADHTALLKTLTSEDLDALLS